MSYMQDIPIKNRELLQRLDAYRDFLLDDKEQFQKDFHLACSQEKDQRHFWAGKDHLEEIQAQGSRHEGFPDKMYGYEMSIGRKGHEFFEGDTHPSVRTKRTADIAFMNKDIMQWLGTRCNALTAWYPPGGFISWHNNANAAAYNLIFSWSETGDGQFEYVDPVSKEVVVMKDKQGWNCKAAYFGHYGEPENLFYHAAKTDCWRCTVSFTFDISQASLDYRDDLIEEITSEI